MTMTGQPHLMWERSGWWLKNGHSFLPILPFSKFMQHMETCSLIAEADRVLCHLVMFLTVFFYWMYKMKSSCYQDSSVFHYWFVYCAFV